MAAIKPKQKRKSYLPKDADGKIKAGPGRGKGTPNKITREAKEMIALAFEGLGGLKMLIETANSSDSMRMTFYTQLYAKLIPVQVAGSIDHHVSITDDEERAALKLAFLSVINARARSGNLPLVIDAEPSEKTTPQLVISSKTGTKAS